MISIALFVIPALVAVICLALDRWVPTQVLGMIAGVACLLDALLLFALRDAPPLLVGGWQDGPGEVLRLALQSNDASWGVAWVLLFGSGLTLMALAATLGSGLRGFAGLFAALLLSVNSVLLAVALPLWALPLALALTTLFGFVALRAARVSSGDRVPGSLLGGMLAALLLMASGVVVARPGVSLTLAVVAVMLVAGLAPFHGVFDDLTEAPAYLAAMVLAFGPALVAGIIVIRLVGPPLPDYAQASLVALSVVSVVTTAAGAIGERRLRRLVAWQMSAQLSWLPILLLLPAGSALAIGILLVSVMLVTGVSLLACMPLERRLGHDDIGQIPPGERQVVAGIALLFAALGAVGVPGSMSFWPRLWAFGWLQQQYGWAMPLLLAGSLLLAASFLVPLAALWRRPPTTAEQAATSSWVQQVVRYTPLVLIVPLVIGGVIPQATFWLFGGDVPSQLQPGLVWQVVTVVATLLLLLLPWLAAQIQPRRVQVDPEQPAVGVQPLLGLAQEIAWLAAIAQPTTLLHAVWNWIQTGADLLRRVLQPLEKRYALAGMVLGAVVVILLVL